LTPSRGNKRGRKERGSFEWMVIVGSQDSRTFTGCDEGMIDEKWKLKNAKC
jgi:hypothetical protein